MLSHIEQHLIAYLMKVASLTVWLVILTVVFLPLERFFALHAQRVRARSLFSDLAYYFLNGLFPTVILAVPISMLAAAVSQVTPQGYLDVIAALPIWAKILIGMLISEIGGYWGHRWSHENRLLWGFHRVHHSPESLDWLVNTRAHPLDIVFTRLCALAPLYALSLASTRGDGQVVPTIVAFVGLVWAFFIHANVRWRLGPLEWLVSTPAFHHWHHTNDEHRDHNYAALFPMVDRLFGTHHLPDQWPPQYGVDEPSPPTFAGQLLDPLTFPVARARPAVASDARSDA
ncbi:sterol desaturase family protein [Phenylobacterium sp.]|jgi:sterol desaturase/sphingolipid hydroxylase (fatty acid hydroxylase superfamily)|uniref:sterol desaturase family protein n=1 Tax=Phenylobacterium sp. TaxID=1871053 RepID=UPI002F3E2E0F